MRKIKFLAWDKRLKRFVIPRYVNLQGKTLSADCKDDRCWSSSYRFDELEFIQYTGFQDRKGIEIFEGWIVREGCNGLIGTVVWDNDIGTYKLEEYGDYYIKDAPIEWTVIGNIYENPELLKSGPESIEIK